MPRILLVDDSPVIQLMHKAMLDQLGYTDYAIAEQGGIALERFIAEPFDLVITDYNMPEMNGAEFTKAIRDRGSVVPVIMVTSEGQREIELALHSGVSVVLEKPTTVTLMGEAIRKFI